VVRLRRAHPGVCQEESRRYPMTGVTWTALSCRRGFTWEGYVFTVDWMPGQTEFALCLHGIIDGLKVAFTGDNIFGDPSDPGRPVMKRWWRTTAPSSRKLHLCWRVPQAPTAGHPHWRPFLRHGPPGEVYRTLPSLGLRDAHAFRALSSERDYRYGFDPFWVRAEPYRVSVAPGQRVEVRLHVRNFQRGRQAHRIEIHTPPGIVAEPRVLEDGSPAGRATLPGCIQRTAGPILASTSSRLTSPLMVAAMASDSMHRQRDQRRSDATPLKPLRIAPWPGVPLPHPIQLTARMKPATISKVPLLCTRKALSWQFSPSWTWADDVSQREAAKARATVQTPVPRPSRGAPIPQPLRLVAHGGDVFHMNST